MPRPACPYGSSLAVLLLAAAITACGTQPRFTADDALQAELARRPPAVAATALPPADRARLQQTLARIGAPDAPPLLPPELAEPTLEAWRALAHAARTPEARFTALVMLNRLKSPEGLDALAGLGPADAVTWPRALHLDNAIAGARLLGGKITAELQAFLDARAATGPVDPVRQQAARLRLVLGGLEPALHPPVLATPTAVLALMDALGRAKPEERDKLQGYKAFLLDPEAHLDVIGLRPPLDPRGPQARIEPLARTMLLSRWLEALPDPAPAEAWPTVRALLTDLDRAPLPLRWPALEALPRFSGPEVTAIAQSLAASPDVRVVVRVLPALRKLSPQAADALRDRLLLGAEALARAVAIEDLPAPPTETQALVAKVLGDRELDALQTLCAAVERWNLSADARRALLMPFLRAPTWSFRFEAWQALRKVDPALPWPVAPPPNDPSSEVDRQIHETARELVATGAPVRLRLQFEGARTLVLRLDPRAAPQNVANLVRLARAGFYDGRRVGRVVPDFVVQMGSPHDTMDGGPGYTVRCENSLGFYGPGSVGMALSGKDTGGSQFFVTLNATPHLTGRYTRVGEVEDPEQALALLDALELGARIERVTVEP